MHPPSWRWSRNSSRSCCVALKLNRGRWQQSWRGEARDCAHQERQNCQLIWRMTAPNAWWVKLFFLGKNSGSGSQLQASWVNLCWQVHREAHLNRMCRLVTRMLSQKMRRKGEIQIPPQRMHPFPFLWVYGNMESGRRIATLNATIPPILTFLNSCLETTGIRFMVRIIVYLVRRLEWFSHSLQKPASLRL